MGDFAEMNCRFSVIVPLYNKAPYVCKALESVCAQTYRDFEIVVVNDGSTDESEVLARQILNEKSDGIPYKIINQPNAGVAAARNNGVAASCGEYVAFLDADDWWCPEFLEEVNQMVVDYPEAGMYATNYVYYKPGKTHVALNMPDGYMDYPKAYLQSSAMPIWTGATSMARRAFDDMGGFPLGVRLGEDFLLWAKTAVHYRIAYINKPLAYYNNDVPVSLRATRNLHAPEHNMLFLLEPLEAEIAQIADESIRNTWKSLFDRLRVNGLLSYWLDNRYHQTAEKELQKVDWTKQPQSVIRLYKMPIWLLRIHRQFMSIGSFYKQKLVHLIKTFV